MYTNLAGNIKRYVGGFIKKKLINKGGKVEMILKLTLMWQNRVV